MQSFDCAGGVFCNTEIFLLQKTQRILQNRVDYQRIMINQRKNYK